MTNESLSHTPLRTQDLDAVLSVLGALDQSPGNQTLDSSIGILGNLVIELQRVENQPLITTDTANVRIELWTF